MFRLALGLALERTASNPIHITDLSPMLALMQHNISLNFASSSDAPVLPSVYSWGEPPPVGVPVPPEIVLAADCVYFEPAFPLLLKTLGDLIGERTVCWFCFKRRRRADMWFSKELKRLFNVTEIGLGEGADVPEDLKKESEIWRRDNIHLYVIDVFIEDVLTRRQLPSLEEDTKDRGCERGRLRWWHWICYLVRYGSMENNQVHGTGASDRRGMDSLCKAVLLCGDLRFLRLDLSANRTLSRGCEAGASQKQR